MKKTWINISDVLFFQEGPGVRNTQYTTEGVKLLNVANLVDGKVDLSTSDRYISEDEAYGKYKHFLCDAGDFIIASSGIKVEYIDKKMGFIDESMLPLCMNTSTIRFKVLDDNQLRIRYFMYYLKSQHFKNQLFKQITGSAQLNYGPSHLKKMIMPLINLSKQDESIACMDKVQSIIERRQQELVKLDTLIKARFVEMFGDPVENPNGYYVATLQELIDKGYITYHLDGNHGGDYPRSEEFVDSGIPYISANCIVNGEIDFSKAKYLTSERASKLRKGIARDDDVLFAHNATVGPTVVLHTVEEKVILGTSLTAYRCNKEKIMPNYLKTYMMSDGFVRQYSGGMKQTTRNQVPITVQKKYLFLIPPIKEQNQFADFVHQVDKSKVTVQKGY